MAPVPLQLIERRMHVNRLAIEQYAHVTNDYNPIHLDAEFAAKTAMGGIIAHGMLSLSLLWQSMQATFGNERLAGAEMDVRFVKPVRQDDWVVAGGERVEGKSAYQVWVRAERSDMPEIVISGSITIDATTYQNTQDGGNTS